ncbi:MAG: DCC1-like thiol-disulfide oxidoreductase family protein [Pseudomonadota bacterium]
MITQRAAYSYQDDPSVAAFDDGGCVAVMDAQCGLCAKGARWIDRYDKREEFRIIPVQSDLGSALLLHFGLDPDDPTSWLLIVDGQASSSLEAFMRAGRRLGGVWRALRVFSILPRRLQDPLYRFVARNRYKFFGRTDLCALPDPEVQKRLLK